MKQFLLKKKKFFYIFTFILVFIYTVVNNIPSWVLADLIEKYSQKHLKLYNTDGTLWRGSGLLVAMDTKQQMRSSPVLYLDWHLSMGLKRFIQIRFLVGKKQIAEIYLNKDGVNVDNLEVSLSISQVSQLVDVIHNLGISGNLKVTAKHILLAKANQGEVNVQIDNVSSTISRVNPLGNYNMNVVLNTGDITMHSSSDSVLNVSGTGNFNGLTLDAKVRDDKKDDMLQLMTAIGKPMPDGSYKLKIF